MSGMAIKQRHFMAIKNGQVLSILWLWYGESAFARAICMLRCGKKNTVQAGTISGTQLMHSLLYPCAQYIYILYVRVKEKEREREKERKLSVIPKAI